MLSVDSRHSRLAVTEAVGGDEPVGDSIRKQQTENGRKHTMDKSQYTNRRTVLKTLGASAVGGTVLTGTATAHGGEREQAWLLTDVWEMADTEPSGEEPTDDNSHVPIYYIAPGATNQEGDGGCAQVKGKEFRKWANLDDSEAEFKDGAWNSVDVDQTLHDLAGTEEPPITEFSPLWHVHFVFDGDIDKNKPYRPDHLVNGTEEELTKYGPFVNSGERILKAQSAEAVQVVSAPFVFNCPARPAQGNHLNYCD